MNAKRKKYTAEFREEAAKLVLKQGHSLAVAAQSLGVSPANISRWVLEQRTGKPAAGKAPQALSAEQIELETLRKENKRLRLEREILKKAAAFFANESH